MYLLAVGVSASGVKLAAVFGLYGQVCANEEAIVPSTDSFVRRDKAPIGLGSCGQEVAMFVLASLRLNVTLSSGCMLVRKCPRLVSQDTHAQDKRVAFRFVRAVPLLHFLLPSDIQSLSLLCVCARVCVCIYVARSCEFCF